MRKRYGAIHSDTTEDFIASAILAEDHVSVYYTGIISKQNIVSDFKNLDFDFQVDNLKTRESTRENSQEDLEQWSEEIEREVRTIVVACTGADSSAAISKYLGLVTEQSRALNFSTQSTSDGMFEKITKFWIIDTTSSQHTEIINQYKMSAQTLFFVDESADGEQLRQWSHGLDANCQVFRFCYSRDETLLCPQVVIDSLNDLSSQIAAIQDLLL